MAAVRRPQGLLTPILILILVLVLCLASPSVSDPEADDALLRFKDSFDDNGALVSWVPGSHPCSGWNGVVCFNNIITGLHLSDLGLSGKIDVEALLPIRSLRTISFINNDFSGPIPEFNRLGALKSLLLSKNHFSGKIPSDFFSRMLSLKKVWLSGNNFTGPIPASLALLPNLMELHLERNQFSGSIPSMEKEKLTSLDLSYNRLEGRIPETLRKFGENSFKGNEGLCGKPLGTVCSDPAGNPRNDASAPSSALSTTEAHKSENSQTVIWTVLGLLAAGVLFSAIYSSRKRETQFSVLGKEVVHDAVEVHVSSSYYSKAASSGRKGSLSKRGSSKGGRNEAGDIIMVNTEKGTFGLSDLMKAAAEVLGNGGLGSAYKAVMANGFAVVVKRLREMNRLGRDGFDAEIRKLGSLRHQNILTPLAYHYRREEKLLVSEYIPKGSLLYVLHGTRLPSFPSILFCNKDGYILQNNEGEISFRLCR